MEPAPGAIEPVLVKLPSNCPSRDPAASQGTDHKAEREPAKPVELRAQILQDRIGHSGYAEADHRDAALSSLFRKHDREAPGTGEKSHGFGAVGRFRSTVWTWFEEAGQERHLDVLEPQVLL